MYFLTVLFSMTAIFFAGVGFGVNLSKNIIDGKIRLNVPKKDFFFKMPSMFLFVSGVSIVIASLCFFLNS